MKKFKLLRKWGTFEVGATVNLTPEQEALALERGWVEPIETKVEGTKRMTKVEGTKRKTK